MRAHYLQHVPFEGPGSIETWLKAAEYEISSTKFFSSEELPELDDIDMLVVMGGPMSVNDEQDYPSLVEEKKFINRIIQAGKPTLGVCLGAQLIANSLGSDVFPNSAKEIGWFPVRATNSDNDRLFHFPEEIDVFHWHGETFCLPSGAALIATSNGCTNQAFQIGSSVIGLQFHLETTPGSLQAIVENCRDELVEGQYIQTAEEMLSVPHERYSTINTLMGNVLEYLHNHDGQ